MKLQLIGLVIAVFVIGVYFRFDPAVYPFPKCPFWALTGYKCPGCGSQRAMHYMLHGQLGSAFYMNPLFVLALPYVLLGLVLEYSDWGRVQIAIRRRWYGYWAARFVLLTVLTFWAARLIWHF